MTNAVLQAIADRRSNRGYAPRQLTEEELGAILTAAVQAPSARNTQPWHFSVVQNAALLKEFSDDYNALQTADPGRDILFFAAPTVVFISTPIEAPTKFSQIDCGIAAQNMAVLRPLGVRWRDYLAARGFVAAFCALTLRLRFPAHAAVAAAMARLEAGALETSTLAAMLLLVPALLAVARDGRKIAEEKPNS